MRIPDGIRRTLYVGYYARTTDFTRIRRFQEHVRKTTGVPAAAQWADVVRSSLRYNTSFDEYYLFRFFERDHAERLNWAGTGTMYEYQRIMAPPAARVVLSHKPTFLRVFREFVRHQHATIDELRANPRRAGELLSSGERLVLKASDGQCGRGIVVVPTTGLKPADLLAALRQSKNDMVESFVEQHPDLARLSNAGLNTVRVITQLDQTGAVHILGARLRVTVDRQVDNLAAGNIAAEIDAGTGRVCGRAVYSDITKEPVAVHPRTHEPIVGFQVPNWTAVLDLVERAARVAPQNRSIGWDVAVTAQSPGLIEGNHDWCKLLWQLPADDGRGVGLKPVLDRYLQER